MRALRLIAPATSGVVLGAAWGLPAYLAPVLEYGERRNLAVTVLVIGALLIWQFSRPVQLRRLILLLVVVAVVSAVACLIWLGAEEIRKSRLARQGDMFD